jgi:hypothetical protein
MPLLQLHGSISLVYLRFWQKQSAEDFTFETVEQSWTPCGHGNKFQKQLPRGVDRLLR